MKEENGIYNGPSDAIILVFGPIILYILIYIGFPALLIITTYITFQKRKKLNNPTPNKSKPVQHDTNVKP